MDISEAEILELIEDAPISKEKIEEQLKLFRKGVPYVSLIDSAGIGNGIRRIPKDRHQHYPDLFEFAANTGRIQKFVPASGAATRMFKEIITEYNELKNNPATEPGDAILTFAEHIQDFAFYNLLSDAANNEKLTINQLIEEKEYLKLIELVLFKPGLNYSKTPKGLIEFHGYGRDSKTPLEEHITEALHYAIDADNQTHIHFTITRDHLYDFEDKVRDIADTYKDHVDLDITFSFQSEETNTIAVDQSNDPIIYEENLLFRPGGHGALIKNLQDLNADIVVIKNIDNVVRDRFIDDTILNKQLLIGLLVELQKKAFEYLELLAKGDVSYGEINEISEFAFVQLSIPKINGFESLSRAVRRNYLFDMLNRPIRVCGMVKNSGEPGGGPFWVELPNKGTTLQIIEKAQINTKDKKQAEILESSTHFNPVDLVCGCKDYEGNNFDLTKFVAEDLSFISRKFQFGMDMKVLELPGLWNGSMAYWNTVFVEVPISTFNPVKTVFDLLRPEHQ